MTDIERLHSYPTTEKQRGFEWDFRKDVDQYEVWDEVQVGQIGTGAQTYLITEDDVLDFNQGALETDPRYVDAEHARTHGGPRIHPLFCVAIAFYCIDRGMGSWIRTPGARNPGQDIEIHEQFEIGEEITLAITHYDKWVRRGNYYMQDKLEYRNQDGARKVTWYVSLLLPKTRTDIQRFASA